MNPENSILARIPTKVLKAITVGVGLLVLLSLIAVFVNLYEPASQKAEPSAEAQIGINKDGFLPATITVRKGTKVTWTNKDSKPHQVASNPHPAHDGLRGLDSKDIIGVEGGTYSYTFDQPGEYTYHDHLKPTTNGVVKVVN